MERRRFLAASGTLGLSFLAGCSGLNQTSPETVSQTESPTVITGQTPTSTRSVPPDEITPYDSLTEQGKELFRDIVETGPIERASDKIPPKLSEAEYVQYKNDVYRLSKSNPHTYVAEYTLEVNFTSQSEVDESELVAYPDLSEAAQIAFKEALDEGSYTVRDGTLPGELREIQYVKYEESYYELQIIVADIPVWELSTTKHE